MARDYEDIFSLDGLGDDELRDLVRQQLADLETLDVDSIVVTVENGVVALSGRVGTESERRVAEHVLTDVIGLSDFQNNLVVDAIRRDEEPEAIDDHLSQVADSAHTPPERAPDDVMGPESEHLVEDLDAMLYGTADLQSAIERGTAWVPPDSPTPEGLSADDADPGARGEDH